LSNFGEGLVFVNNNYAFLFGKREEGLLKMELPETRSKEKTGGAEE
jgi:hypothetical protein